MSKGKGGATGTFLACSRLASSDLSEARADGAVVLRCDRRLDGDIGTHRGRVAVKIAVESEQTREREAVLRLDRRRQPVQWRRSAWSTRTLSWLILGAPSSKRRFAVVDAVPTPTPTPLLDAIRARAEICVLRAALSAEMACGACAANVMCLELDCVCTFIDLVLSSSIDHTVRLPVTPTF